MEAELKCQTCNCTYDCEDNFPYLLRKCKHIICNPCKIKALVEKVDDDYVVLVCPVCCTK